MTHEVSYPLITKMYLDKLDKRFALIVEDILVFKAIKCLIFSGTAFFILLLHTQYYTNHHCKS